MSDLCRRLDLPTQKCAVLESYLRSRCKPKPGERAARARSRWQECIAKRRAGQKFDPQAIRELAKEYKAGRCP